LYLNFGKLLLKLVVRKHSTFFEERGAIWDFAPNCDEISGLKFKIFCYRIWGILDWNPAFFRKVIAAAGGPECPKPHLISFSFFALYRALSGPVLTEHLPSGLVWS
jgi:hypothetical protein